VCHRWLVCCSSTLSARVSECQSARTLGPETVSAWGARTVRRKLLDLHALGADCEDPQFCDEVEKYLGEQV